MTNFLIYLVVGLFTCISLALASGYYNSYRARKQLERVLGDALSDLKIKRRQIEKDYREALDNYRKSCDPK